MASTPPPTIVGAVPYVQQFLDAYGIPWCLGGSVALWVRGYTGRNPHDIDVLVGASRQQISHAFRLASRMSATQDPGGKLNQLAIVPYHYQAPSQDPITIEFFLINMTNIEHQSIATAWMSSAAPVASLIVTMKAKVHALATRGQDKDKLDALWILARLSPTEVSQLDPTLVGLTISNFPVFEAIFSGLGCNTDQARAFAESYRQRQQNLSPDEYVRQFDLSRRIIAAIRSGLPDVQQPIPLLGPPQVIASGTIVRGSRTRSEEEERQDALGMRQYYLRAADPQRRVLLTWLQANDQPVLHRLQTLVSDRTQELRNLLTGLPRMTQPQVRQFMTHLQTNDRDLHRMYLQWYARNMGSGRNTQ